MKTHGGISASALADRLGVDEHVVECAIIEKRLRASRTQHPGWCIRDADIATYIIANLHEIDLGSVDKEWFVQLLTGIPRQQRPATKDRPAPEQVLIPFGSIHIDSNYFLCARLHCTLRKTVCIRRQTEVLKDGTGHIMIECWACEQGHKIAAELGVTVINPQPEDLRHKSFSV